MISATLLSCSISSTNECPHRRLKFPGKTWKYDESRPYTGFDGYKILYKSLEFFDNIFVPTFCRRRYRDALYGENILSMGKCFAWARFQQTYLGSSMRGRWKWQRLFFLQVSEICKRRQSCCSTVPRTVKHRHQRMWRFCRRSRNACG